MKKTLITAAFLVSATAGFSGTPETAVVTPEVIAADVQGSSAPIVVPLILLVAMAAAIADK